MIHFDGPLSLGIFIVEILGCISFATSGAITAIRKKADYVGVIVLTLIEIFGGGLLRDLILNQGVPHIFYDPEYLFLALLSIIIASIWFIIAYFRRSAGIIDRHRHDKWIYIVDAIGVSVFCIAGCQFANNVIVEGITIEGKYTLCICSGVITGVCGGMCRDVFVGEIPMVFKKHFYMIPCLLGCLIYVVMAFNGCNDFIAMIVGVLTIITLRTLATIYKWNLPSAKGYDELISLRNDKVQDNNK
ncbi:MAG: trimeric intracellular cation channel family protein [Bacilli bacterium]